MTWSWNREPLQDSAAELVSRAYSCQWSSHMKSSYIFSGLFCKYRWFVPMCANVPWAGLFSMQASNSTQRAWVLLRQSITSCCRSGPTVLHAGPNHQSFMSPWKWLPVLACVQGNSLMNVFWIQVMNQFICCISPLNATLQYCSNKINYDT